MSVQCGHRHWSRLDVSNTLQIVALGLKQFSISKTKHIFPLNVC